MRRPPLLAAAAAIVVVAVAAASISVVPESKQAVVMRLGDPVAVVNRYRPGERPGAGEAGPLLRLPLVDDVVFIDKRVQTLDLPRQEVSASDGSRFVADAVVRYRITDPVAVARAGGGEARVADAVAPVVLGALQKAVAAEAMGGLVGPAGAVLTRTVLATARPAARRIGAELVDVRLTRVSLPEGPLLDQAIDRMQAAWVDQARDIAADGAQRVSRIHADASGRVARIHADSFGRDPQFYAFYRSLQSYRHMLKDGTVAVLSPNSEYLRAFSGR